MSDRIEFWIDTNGCDEQFHYLARPDQGLSLEAKHHDGTKCEVTEFRFWPASQLTSKPSFDDFRDMYPLEVETN